MNKRVILLFSLLFAFIGCCAQDSKAFLQTFVQQMSEKPVEFNFTFTYENLSKDTKESRKGAALCNGPKFRLVTDEVMVWCNGQTKWVYNVAADEVMLFPASEAHDITDNPLQYIQLHANDFKYASKMKRTVEQGRELLHLDMFPQDKKAVYVNIGLTVDAATLQPVLIQYKMKDGQRYTVTITSFNEKSSVKNTDFIFPEYQYPQVEVIDLRKK